MRILKLLLLVVIMVLAASCKENPISPSNVQYKENDERYVKLGKTKSLSASEWYKMSFIGNWYMDTRFIYTMGGIYNGLGDISEILDTATRIRHTSEISWFDEWFATAERVENMAMEAETKGHETSAGEAYLRSAHYFMAAEVFLHSNPGDTRILSTYKRGAVNFMKALTFLKINVQEVRIPFENTTLRGYLFQSSEAIQRAPIIIAHQGFDAPIESTWGLAEAAIKRGWHCLLFEGPGQGLVLREQGIVFQPDWEKPVSAVVDYVSKLKLVDQNRIVLEGISMGGGFAARAAAYEKRLHTVVLNPGYINIRDMFIDMFSEKLLNLQEEDPEEFDKKLLELAKYDVGFRWGIYHAMWVFGARTPSELFLLLEDYNYKNDIPNIRAQTLVINAGDEEYGRGQAAALYELLTAKKELMLFDRNSAASLHCQTGSPAVGYARLFDWLDENVQ